jgi:hypothetical protein
MLFSEPAGNKNGDGKVGTASLSSPYIFHMTNRSVDEVYMRNFQRVGKVCTVHRKGSNLPDDNHRLRVITTLDLRESALPSAALQLDQILVIQLAVRCCSMPSGEHKVRPDASCPENRSAPHPLV